MTKEQIKKLAKVLVPALLALGTAYGYVDSTCSFSCPGPAVAPPAATE